MTAKSDHITNLMNDPYVQEAFDNVRNKYRRAWENPSVNDVDVLELRRMLFLIDSVEKDLRQSIADGVVEDYNAAEEERPAFLGNLLWPKKT